MEQQVIFNKRSNNLYLSQLAIVEAELTISVGSKFSPGKATDDRKEGRRDWHRGGIRDRHGNDETNMILVECIFLSYIDMNRNMDVKDSIDHELFYSCVFRPTF